MRLFWEIIYLAVRRQLTYRAAAWAGLATNIFFGLLRAYLMVALYAGRGEVNGLTLQDAITYTALSQAIIAYLSIFGWWEVMDSINSGDVGTDLLRPMNYLRFWIASDLGRAMVNIILRGATIILIYGIFVDLTLPTSFAQWLAFLVSLLLAWVVSFGWRFLINLAAFWSPNARGIGRFGFGILWIFSGFYMPLTFYPDWFRAFCKLTPFPAMVNTPFEIFLGTLSGQALNLALISQVFWSCALLLICHLVLSRGVHRLVIQGG